MTHRKLFGILSLSVLSLSLATPAAGEVVLVQDEAYPPYMSKQGDKPTGVWADIIEEAGRRMGDSAIKLEASPWSRAVGLVENGRAHGLIGTYYKPEARPWIGTYSVSPIAEQVSVFCHPGKAQTSWKYPNDFKGLTFGNNTGYQSPGAEFFEMVKAGDIKLQEAPTTEQNLKKLSAGRIDCYVQERLTTEIAIKDGNIKNVERVTDASSEDAFIGYTDTWTGPEAESFIKAMDKALTDMKADGTIDGIVAKYVGN